MDHRKQPHLCVNAFGLSLGIISGVCALLASWFAMTGWGVAYVNTMSSVYVAYEPSFFGGIVGLIWGFITGYIGGAVFAWLYNKLLHKCKK